MDRWINVMGWDVMGWDGMGWESLTAKCSQEHPYPALFLLLCDLGPFPVIITRTVVRGSQFILILA